MLARYQGLAWEMLTGCKLGPLALQWGCQLSQQHFGNACADVSRKRLDGIEQAPQEPQSGDPVPSATLLQSAGGFLGMSRPDRES